MAKIGVHRGAASLNTVVFYPPDRRRTEWGGLIPSGDAARRPSRLPLATGLIILANAVVRNATHSPSELQASTTPPDCIASTSPLESLTVVSENSASVR